MATSIFYQGRRTSRPGSFVIVDPTGLEQANIASNGVVALVGDAEGGRPASTMSGPSDFIRLNSPAQVRTAFRSGDLREAAAMTFEPSSDVDIPGGAAQIVAMKTNQSTQSVGNLTAGGSNVITVTSRDYGAFTEQISLEVQTASSGLTGKLLTVSFGTNDPEVVDGIGGDPVVNLSYVTSSDSWDTVTVNTLASGAIQATGTVSFSGLDSHLSKSWVSGDAATITAAAGDAGKSITLYGDVAGTMTTERLVLAAGANTSTTLWTDLYGAILSEPAAASLTVADDIGTALTFSIGQDVRGGVRADAFFVNDSVFNVQIDSTSTADVHLFGQTSVGVSARESITMPGTSGTDVSTTITPRKIEFIGLTEVAAADTVTISGTVAQTSPTVQSTLRIASDYFNSRSEVRGGVTYGFSWTTVGPNLDQPVAQLDELTGLVAGNHPTTGLSADLTADVFAIINYLNNNSQLVSAALASGATKTAPDNTPIPVFLSGGVEGSSSVADFQAALDLLRLDRSINTIVCLTGNSAVHAYLRDHCEFMAGRGRAERDAIVGLVAVDDSGVPTADPGVLPTQAAALAQAQAINSRHVRCVAQSIDRFNTAGVRSTFEPWFGAALAAGMQAGSAVGVSLTYKFVNVLDFSQNTGWNPTDNGEDLISGGIMFMENVQGQGIRWVRNITSYVQDNNLAFTEASVNEAVNFANRTIREAVEFAVGRRGFAGTLNAVKGIALNNLGLLIDEGIITAFRSLSLELNGDVLDISVEIAPVTPINFVRTTLHLVTTNISA